MKDELKFENLSLQLGPRKLFHQLNHSFEPRKITALIGPSGCGKSTWLKIISGLETRFTGRVINTAEAISFVFQEARLIPWMTVKENILLALSSKKIKKEVKEGSLQKVLKLVQLEGCFQLFPHQLSGGMKMRVSLARALIQQPDLILFDEPFAALDEILKHTLQIETRNLIRGDKYTALFVTHSVEEAVFVADEILILDSDSKIKYRHLVKLPLSRNQSLRSEAQYFQEVNLVRRQMYEGQNVS